VIRSGQQWSDFMPFFMKKNTRIPKDKAKDIPDDFKSFYKEEGEELVLDEAQMTIINLIDGLNNTNARLRTDVDTLKSSVDLSELKEFGDDIPTIKAKFQADLKALKDEVKDKGGKNIDFEKAKADLIAERDRAVAEAKAETQSTRSRMHGYVKENALRAELAAAGGSAALLLPALMGQLSVVEEGETFRTVVMGPDGKHRVSSTNGELLSVSDLVKEVKTNAEFAPAFKSEAPSGGPTAPSLGSGGGTTQRKTGSDMSAREKIAAGLKKTG
jgi:hypothetical protein